MLQAEIKTTRTKSRLLSIIAVGGIVLSNKNRFIKTHLIMVLYLALIFDPSISYSLKNADSVSSLINWLNRPPSRKRPFKHHLFIYYPLNAPLKTFPLFSKLTSIILTSIKRKEGLTISYPSHRRNRLIQCLQSIKR